jgi:hypothetical protein
MVIAKQAQDIKVKTMVLMKFILNSLVLLLFISNIDAAPLSDELVVLHNVNTAEMNSISTPAEGSLIFNTDDKEIYERNATAWNRISSDGSETSVVAGHCMKVTGAGTTDDPYVVSYSPPPRTCKEILDAGLSTGDGNYTIDTDGCYDKPPFQVYCDMTTDGGGWTRIDYASDLTHQKQFDTDSDGDRWLDDNFVLTLTDIQIDNIRALSTEGKQHYHGTCEGVIHYYYNSGDNYNNAFGFRYHHGDETEYDQQTYPSTDITVSNDDCARNDSTLRSTDFDIVDIRVPIINVHSRDNGNSNEKFGSPLTNNPAWLR